MADAFGVSLGESVLPHAGVRQREFPGGCAALELVHPTLPYPTLGGVVGSPVRQDAQNLVRRTIQRL